ncbi:MAG: hypothetical protein SGJ13_07170 [Actinomycetota bacterium]|nr:hypothetical protein [Actinomycetota bacterium]
MWGDVTPAERLRAIARRSVSDDDLAIEAADALAGFAVEPAHLVVACRRVLAHRRRHGTLWWLCARILAAPDPVAAAREATAMLGADRTASRIAATLPLLDEDEVVAVVGWPPAVDEALAERQDVAAVSVRVDGVDPTSAQRYRRSERAVRIVDQWDPILERIRVLFVAADAVGPDHAVVPEGTGAVVDAFGRVARETWLVGGVGRVLPGRLFEALAVAAPDAEMLSLQRVDRLAGTRGVEPPTEAAKRADCPVAPELLRPLD